MTSFYSCKFTAWQISPILIELRDKDHGGDSVVDCGLRVALRKRHNRPFNCPLDVRTKNVTATMLQRATSKAVSFFGVDAIDPAWTLQVKRYTVS